jgi:hypothetical protein
MTDPLPEIKRQLTSVRRGDTGVAWLVGEVERLRGLLGRLEWAGTICWAEDSSEGGDACPACSAFPEEGHLKAGQHMGPDGKPYDYPGCWLAAELAPNADDPPEGEQP